MAEDEDPQIAAALAKLGGLDAAAAEDARAALEWVAGDQGLVFITQQRIQNFCWYDLPVKWFIGLDDKLRVVAALARALDLLELPRYAAVCRSGTTREVLSAYEAGIAQGKAAFRRAAAASGVMPPDLPDFQWGPAMGFEEASAWSSTAEFLEVAVSSGDLVPGRRGWKTRQQELIRAHLNVPQAGLLGQTLAQVILTERAETWINARCSETRRGKARKKRRGREAGGGMRKRQSKEGRSADRFGWDFSRPPRTEDDLYDLYQLRHFAQDLGLARRSGRKLTLTAKGRGLLADPGSLWRAVAAGLLGDNGFFVYAGELFLALLLGAGPVPDRELTAAVGQAVAEEGFRETRTFGPPDEHDISRAIRKTSNLCRALGLLASGGDWRDRSYGLTSTGQATALEALRSRATGPHTVPWP